MRAAAAAAAAAAAQAAAEDDEGESSDADEEDPEDSAQSTSETGGGLDGEEGEGSGSEGEGRRSTSSPTSVADSHDANRRTGPKGANRKGAYRKGPGSHKSRGVPSPHTPHTRNGTGITSPLTGPPFGILGDSVLPGSPVAHFIQSSALGANADLQFRSSSTSPPITASDGSMIYGLQHQSLGHDEAMTLDSPHVAGSPAER